MTRHMSTFIERLSQLSGDPDSSVRCCVCQSIILLSSFQLVLIYPILDSICSFMIQATSDPVSPFLYCISLSIDVFLYLNVDHGNDTNDR